MAHDDWDSEQDHEGFVPFPRKILAFLTRNGITMTLVFLLLLPFLNLLPLELHNFTFDHPSLLLGPLLIMAPVFLAYHLNWERAVSVENGFFLGGLLIFGMIISGALLFWGLMTAQFICPDGYPFTDFSIPDTSSRRTLKVVFVDVICHGEPGVHVIPKTFITWITYGVFIVTGLLSAGVSFVFGRQSRLFPRGDDAGQLHFVRYFVIAVALCMAFLALPEYFPGANFLAGRYESGGRKSPMKDPQIMRYSPIHGAALLGDAPRMEGLLKAGANLNAIVNGGLTPLGIAVEKKDARMVRMLVEAKADINLGEKIKQSAMQLAFQGKNPDLIAYLRKHGGNPLAVAKGGFGLLASAVEKLHLKAARKLLEKGANPNIKFDSQSLLFRTIFEVNADYYKQARGSQIRSIKMALLLLKHGAKLESRNRYGETPLVFAIGEDNIWMVKLFLAQGSEVNTLDRDGNNSLHRALKGRFFRKKILALLVEKGVKINHQNNRGRTALISLIQHERSLRLIQWLLRHGAEVNVVDKSGQTALDKLGTDYWDDKKRKLLLDAGAKSALAR